jgi:hypothetical protein
VECQIFFSHRFFKNEFEAVGNYQTLANILQKYSEYSTPFSENCGAAKFSVATYFLSPLSPITNPGGAHI